MHILMYQKYPETKLNYEYEDEPFDCILQQIFSYKMDMKMASLLYGVECDHLNYV